MDDYNIFVLDLDLTRARANERITIGGLKNGLLIRSIDDTNANLSIRFNESAENSIPILQGDNFKFPKADFRYVYVTNDAISAGNAVFILTKDVDINKPLRLTADIVQLGLNQQVVSVDNAVATAIPAVALSERTNIMLYNNTATTVYLGNSTVTTAGATQGIPLVAGASIALQISQGVPIYGIAAGGAPVNINILEGA